MAYFITGATGFIGRFLVTELLAAHTGTIYLLCRPESHERLASMITALWSDDSRLKVVTGDLSQPHLGLSPQWLQEHQGTIQHFFHLAAIYDMTADEELNQLLNVTGTQAALEVATQLQVGCFHHVSSVAVAGNYVGMFDESMFDEGQELTSPYHRTKYAAEKIVRTEATLPWRIYRPAIVVGHSETGEMDKIDGPYYFFGLLQRLRRLPSWLPLLGVDLGDTNMVPVDYVAKSMTYLAHKPGLDQRTFHLVNPEPQTVIDMLNLFAAAAQAPQFALPVDRSMLNQLPTSFLPYSLRPGRLVSSLATTGPAQFALRHTIGRLGIPAEVVAHASFRPTFVSTATQKALSGSRLAVPDLESYAATLWNYWEEHLNDSIRSDPQATRALCGKTVVITGASSGIGKVSAIRVAKAGGVVALVSRRTEELERLRYFIERDGGQAHVYPCDLADLDEIDLLIEALLADFGQVDFIVNNAGRSIRRSLKLSEDRFHDFERTMQLNYFGAVRLVMGLLPRMRAQKQGHIVNVSSIGVLTNPPRFSAYVASKAALDAWSSVVASELLGDGISLTTIHMPLVRTPMISPTRLYDHFPTISAGQAATKVIDALVRQPPEINTLTGNLGALAHTFAPRVASRVLNMAYRAFPDSAAARGKPATGAEPLPTGDQALLSHALKGVHW